MNIRKGILMATDGAFRHELKYLMSRREMDACMSRLMQFSESDSHASRGRYYVRSLYFDDMYMSAYEEKASGVASRHKYRIRIYDMDESVISLEKKIKKGSYIRKESVRLTRAEYDMIEQGETSFLLRKDESVARDFAVECRICGLRPVVIVDYDRTPLVCEHGNVRITFDENIRSVFSDLDIFRGDTPSYEVLGQDELIMEVKYTEYLPDIFHAILPDNVCLTAASKYVMCYDRKMELTREEIFK